MAIHPSTSSSQICQRRVSNCSSDSTRGNPLFLYTAVRLKVEENQLVGIFGEIGVLVDGLKYA